MTPDSCRGVHGELIVKQLREADRVIGSEYSNRSIQRGLQMWRVTTEWALGG
jgi:hypothetical protein